MKCTSSPFHYRDLGVTVHPRVDSREYAGELESLYSSLFSTVDWFDTQEDAPWMGACLLAQPRHVLLFTGEGDSVRILNKGFAIAPVDVERACRALFRAFPHVRRVRIEVMFPPSSLRCPRTVLFASNHMIVDLPPTPDEYFKSLGKSMRKNLRQYENRLRRSFPDFTTEVFPSARNESAAELFEQLLEWKIERFSSRGEKTYWEEHPDDIDSFRALLRRCGEVHLTTISGAAAAIVFAFPVGDGVCAEEWAFDPAYERYRLGILSQYWVACDAISRGYASLNMLWGTEGHKSHFAATPRQASTLLIFRDRLALLSSRETWGVARRSAKRRATREYWRARHAVGRRLRSLR